MVSIVMVRREMGSIVDLRGRGDWASLSWEVVVGGTRGNKSHSSSIDSTVLLSLTGRRREKEEDDDKTERETPEEGEIGRQRERMDA